MHKNERYLGSASAARPVFRRIAVVLFVLVGSAWMGIGGAAIAQGRISTTAEAIRALELKQYDVAVPALKGFAEAGDPDAQVFYAGVYLVGLGGMPEDMTIARRWLLAAAAKGHMVAQFNLGLMSERGQSTPADPVAAIAWYEKAAEQNFPLAIQSLARCYLEGIGVVRNPAKAAEQLLRLAQNGDPDSQNMLGVLIGKQEITGSQGEAYAWFAIAADAGQEEAKRNLGMAREKMTPEQIAEGERLIADWRTKR